MQVGLTFKVDLAVASTSRPEYRFPCILASQFDAEEDRRRQRKGNTLLCEVVPDIITNATGLYRLDLPVHVRRRVVAAGLAIGSGRRWSRTGEEFTFLAALLLAVLFSTSDAVFVLLNEGSAAGIFGDVVP